MIDDRESLCSDFLITDCSGPLVLPGILLHFHGPFPPSILLLRPFFLLLHPQTQLRAQLPISLQKQSCISTQSLCLLPGPPAPLVPLHPEASGCSRSRPHPPQALGPALFPVFATSRARFRHDSFIFNISGKIWHLNLKKQT